MLKTKKIVEYIVSWLKKYIQKYKSNGFIIGISGGVDSSLTSLLVAKTKFPTIVLEMPILEKKNFLSKKHVTFLKSKFKNVNYLKKDLSDIYVSFCKIMNVNNKKKDEKTLLSLANVKSRFRMLTLYYYANKKNYLVVGTGNKIEDFGVGFFTKYGDGGVDLQPIADLMKSEIFLLAKELNIPSEIQNANPTDGLWEDKRTDEDQLGASYEELEWAMNIFENNTIKHHNTNFSYQESKILEKYYNLHKKNHHKIKPIPICKIPDYLKNNMHKH
ncbi:NAD(+) synthase [Blattabacterium cuenoti]|uniref:NAD(+) synthase n=1 Tax=Blattabacterium cuenoti TaxID=1653831 RepID=UPI00163B7BAC|nr:NAD(+) synthase [Blattabacterium cuenoti]